MSLRSITSERLILLDQPWRDRATILDRLCQRLYEEGNVSDKAAFLEAVWQREKLSETGFEQGVAIPHGKSAVVARPAFAVARVTQPVCDWPTLDGEDQVELIFLLAVPFGDDAGHLRLLSTLSLSLMDEQMIVAHGSSSTLMLAAIIASLTAFDLGGPVNKSAGAIAIGLAADHIFPLTARVLGIVIPPIGIGLATLLDRLIVRQRVFDENQRITGTTSLILGFLAIGEGAIPFMLKNPLITISINITGAVIGALTAITLGSVQWYPLPAIWGWPLVQNLPAYLSGMVAGVAFIAFANIFVRYALIRAGKMHIE
ncbi:fructose PTS transporter subunit IIA [Enterobacter sp. ENT03]|uniref:fructose PTS transporter subunit IIA n=1 Tax=Enterobacter sp. ENT03 TaxID=2854780 RepID=UPI001C453A86|nr:fructose PTS transporter subunit IIA [Enterobacter sp. ENT03]MBV7405548.1 fructose PTS transporter subunit IIA [Enterobacter sp. ENT03]